MTYIYIYIYIYMHVWLNNEDTFCLYNFFLDPFKFLDKCFGFSLVVVDEFTEIVLSAFGLFRGLRPGWFAKIKFFFF